MTQNKKLQSRYNKGLKTPCSHKNGYLLQKECVKTKIFYEKIAFCSLIAAQTIKSCFFMESFMRKIIKFLICGNFLCGEFVAAESSTITYVDSCNDSFQKDGTTGDVITRDPAQNTLIRAFALVISGGIKIIPRNPSKIFMVDVSVNSLVRK
jgi:hypothetical protein